ncbi:hypothetical protein RRG08_009466 [Elysia crispata]|uniref:Uncharacterized protein n=1 Tax=Elysia crispata TaxID=231223 RepID=A0AAE1AUR8_9GAST|nr:hypothetical protein RRG08_009466 [Elysia crispata]
MTAHHTCSSILRPHFSSRAVRCCTDQAGAIHRVRFRTRVSPLVVSLEGPKRAGWLQTSRLSYPLAVSTDAQCLCGFHLKKHLNLNTQHSTASHSAIKAE